MQAGCHGVLMAVQQCGVLILGAPGTGKSQLGLELLDRGHQFVADDVVQLRRQGEQLLGSGDPELGGFLALRGGLIIDVAAQFGADALRTEQAIDLCVAAGPPRPPFAALARHACLGLTLPRHDLGRLPGSAVCVEALVNALRLARQGHDAAAELAARQARQLQRRPA